MAKERKAIGQKAMVGHPIAQATGIKTWPEDDRPMSTYMIYKIFLIITILTFGSGCSYALHERKPDPKNHSDQGSKTEIELKGPKAGVSHKF